MNHGTLIAYPEKDQCLYCKKCIHCKIRHGLRYYMESGKDDLYFCEHTFKLLIWNGKTVRKTKGEAYPNRDK